MSKNDDEKTFPTPAVVTRKPKFKSLDLEHVDMSKGGAQGEVLVSKGSASTFVSLTSDEEGHDE